METKSKVSMRCLFFMTSVGIIPSTFLLPTRHILGLSCIRLLNAAHFCENYAKLYFDANHSEKGLNSKGGGGIFGAFFQISGLFSEKMYPFLANIKRCPKFLEYPLTSSTISIYN